MAAGSDDCKRDEAKRAYGAKDYRQAVRLYSELIEGAESEDNQLHIYYSNRAACYQQLGQNQQALSDAESCCANKPSFTKGHTRLATILTTLGRHRDAAHAWERALQMEPGNATLRSSLDGARQRAGMPSYSGGGDATTSAGGFDLSGLTSTLGQALSQLMGAFANASTQEKAGYGLALILCLYYIYKWIYSWFFPSFGHSGVDYYDSYDDYGYNYGGGYGYGRGLSWTAWLSCMGGAYYIPPLFPSVLGQYAQPFFGMSWTTFMWVLRMVTSGGGGGLGSFGGFGGRRRGRGYY